MDVYIYDFALYTIDVNYLKYLHDVDDDVFYDPNNNYERKPFLGIILGLGDQKYFAPLTSRKPVHASWNLEGENYLLVTQPTPYRYLSPNSVYKKTAVEGLVLEILGALIIGKMIPVNDSLYKKIDIDSVTDLKYQRLLRKEYNFLKGNQNKILDKAKKIYNRQKRSMIILPREVNLLKLEKAAIKYKGESTK